MILFLSQSAKSVLCPPCLNQCFLNAVVQCLSHTRGLRDYCLLKLYQQEKFSKEDAKLTDGTCVSGCLCVHACPCVYVYVLCFLLFHTSLVPLAFVLQLTTKCFWAFGMKTKGTRPWIHSGFTVFSKKWCHTLMVTGESEKNKTSHKTHIQPVTYSLWSLICQLLSVRDLRMHLCVYLSQQDAQEFLRFLLDKLHTEINRRPFVRRPLKEPEQKYTRFRYVISSFFIFRLSV